MTERKYPSYTEEFKLQALALLEKYEKSAGQIERELGITPGMLLKWRARYQTVAQGHGNVHLEPRDLEAARAEIRRLQRELNELREERDTPAA